MSNIVVISSFSQLVNSTRQLEATANDKRRKNKKQILLLERRLRTNREDETEKEEVGLFWLSITGRRVSPVDELDGVPSHHLAFLNQQRERERRIQTHMVLRVVHKMAAQSGDDGIAKQKGKNEKKRESVCVCVCLRRYHEYSLVLFPHQLLAVVLVVIVYDFGRRLALLLLFLLRLLFLPLPLSLSLSLSGWMCRKVGGGLCRPWIYRSIHLSTPSSFFVFFLLFCGTQ